MEKAKRDYNPTPEEIKEFARRDKRIAQEFEDCITDRIILRDADRPGDPGDADYFLYGAVWEAVKSDMILAKLQEWKVCDHETLQRVRFAIGDLISLLALSCDPGEQKPERATATEADTDPGLNMQYYDAKAALKDAEKDLAETQTAYFVAREKLLQLEKATGKEPTLSKEEEERLYKDRLYSAFKELQEEARNNPDHVLSESILEVSKALSGKMGLKRVSGRGKL